MFVKILGMELTVSLSSLLAVYLLNIPFGYWRAGVRKFSLGWVLAIHLPVPIVFAIRFFAGAGWLHIPFFVASFFLGQFTGSKVRRWMGKSAVSLCLIMDLLRSHDSLNLNNDLKA